MAARGAGQGGVGAGTAGGGQRHQRAASSGVCNQDPRCAPRPAHTWLRLLLAGARRRRGGHPLQRRRLQHLLLGDARPLVVVLLLTVVLVVAGRRSRRRLGLQPPGVLIAEAALSLRVRAAGRGQQGGARARVGGGAARQLAGDAGARAAGRIGTRSPARRRGRSRRAQHGGGAAGGGGRRRQRRLRARRRRGSRRAPSGPGTGASAAPTFLVADAGAGAAAFLRSGRREAVSARAVARQTPASTGRTFSGARAPPSSPRGGPWPRSPCRSGRGAARARGVVCWVTCVSGPRRSRHKLALGRGPPPWAPPLPARRRRPRGVGCPPPPRPARAARGAQGPSGAAGRSGRGPMAIGYQSARQRGPQSAAVPPFDRARTTLRTRARPRGGCRG
jgi:hypothetical protein